MKVRAGKINTVEADQFEINIGPREQFKRRLLGRVALIASVALTFVLIGYGAPRLVRLVITSGGLDSLATAGVTRQGQHYVVDVRIGGIGGIVTTAIRKSLPRSHIWISTGIPGFLRAETPLGVDGPMWRIDLAAPVRQSD